MHRCDQDLVFFFLFSLKKYIYIYIYIPNSIQHVQDQHRSTVFTCDSEAPGQKWPLCSHFSDSRTCLERNAPLAIKNMVSQDRWSFVMYSFSYIERYWVAPSARSMWSFMTGVSHRSGLRTVFTVSALHKSKQYEASLVLHKISSTLIPKIAKFYGDVLHAEMI